MTFNDIQGHLSIANVFKGNINDVHVDIRTMHGANKVGKTFLIICCFVAKQDVTNVVLTDRFKL